MRSIYYVLHTSHRVLHSFPTRRSSDLIPLLPGAMRISGRPGKVLALARLIPTSESFTGSSGALSTRMKLRSEEHTSELQSHVNIVCRLLLEKKKHMHKYTFW